MTQADLAERAGASVETIGRLERGAVMPSLQRLDAVADALGLDLADLFAIRVAASTRQERATARVVDALRGRDVATLEMIGDVVARILRG